MKNKPGQVILLAGIIIALGLVWLMTDQEGNAMDKTPDEQQVSRIMDLEKEQPLYLIPVGHSAE